ncbi:lysine-epsilon-oxidase maturase LodB [Rubritalea sp.]|uniref:lysine-epsilon-oxidase maturase LodB n=1 Tax=Rubritalea sp. TaxID=2109375 RepID=UPI003EF41FEA
MRESKVDVLIVGGGPSGVSTALALLKYSKLSVLVVEASDLNRLRVGEHVSSQFLELLEYLGVNEETFDEDFMLPSYGTTSYWGSSEAVDRDMVFSTEQSTYQIDREALDLTLIEKVIEHGGRLWPRSRCTQFAQEDNGKWSVEIKHETEGTRSVRAEFIVDATGRHSSLARLLDFSQKKHDQLVGVGCFLSLPEGQNVENKLVLETSPHGWWYSAKISATELVVTFFTDADIVSKHGFHKSTSWLKALNKTVHTKQRASGSYCEQAAPWVRNAYSQIVDSSSLERFISVGDAACGFDPISSTGLGFALSSASHAARVIREVLASENSDALAVYQNDLNQHFSNYLEQSLKVYQQENRWPNEPFWQRRQNYAKA